MRINNQAYNPEVVNSGTFSKLFVTITIASVFFLTVLNFNQFDSLDFLYTFLNYFTVSILIPLHIYLGNSALRKFTHSSIKEMFVSN